MQELKEPRREATCAHDCGAEADVAREVRRELASHWLSALVFSGALMGGCTGVIADPAANDGSMGASPGVAGSGADPGGNVAGTGSGGTGALNCVSPGAPSSSSSATASPGSAPLRRLSNAEYRNTLTDLFAGLPDVANVVATATREFPAEAESLGFRNSARFLTVQSLNAQKYMDAAEAMGQAVAGQTSVAQASFVGCTPTAGKEMDCAKSFIQSFGKRVYRRALSSEESGRYEALFQKGMMSYDFKTGVEWTVATLLQSPEFLYRVERGEPSRGAVTRPKPSEMAARLSYLFWQSQPDAALTALAESGGLNTPEQIEAQSRTMLADPRAGRLFQYFSEWLDLDRLDDFSREATVFPGLPVGLPTLYASETRAFVSSLLQRPDGNFSELLTAPYTYANQTLAKFYGLSGPTGDGFERVADDRRSGILTQAFLMAQDKPYRTSIVRRGLKLRTDLLCQNIPAPPNNVILNLDSGSADLSQRERLERHRSDPTCAGCHDLLDPVGVVFESFDAVGRYRTADENGRPISTASALTAAASADGPVADVRELGAKLAASPEARDCYVTQSFRFFFGRDVEAADACSIARLKAKFSEKNSSLTELLVGLTQTDAFLYRPTLEVSP